LKPSIQVLFLAASEESTTEERTAYLDEACAGDSVIRQRVEALLSAHDQSAAFLGEFSLDPGLDLSTGTKHVTVGPEVIGTVVGPYKLVQQLGEGGMGTVWVAEQSVPVKRRVALKVIKPGMDSAQILRRFEAEQQALALMDHSNIARVLDAGISETGRPYFAMELVHGVPLTRYCDELNLSIRERLSLFVPVCQAIQHAHQTGIIHRDIKPSNVLVCMQDGQPVPKVIDFGVAKALCQKLTEGTLFTEYGAVVGTIEYMSPEQAEMSSLGVDTRADVYALGVLLYELLTGTTPLSRKRLMSASMLDMMRIIREEEPPKPSTRLTDSKDTLVSLAAHRRTEPGRLATQVRGELDWIVMKCLEKDRTRRYETASELARDVQHYLADEPVEACPPSTAYRLTKFLRRYRGPAIAAMVVLLALLGGIVGTTLGLVQARQQSKVAQTNAEQARQQRDRAESEKQLAQAVRDFLRFKLLRQADAREQANALLLDGRSADEARENPTVRELLDRAAKELEGDKLEQAFPKQPAVQAEILQTLGDTYCGIGQYARATSHLERCRDLRQELLGSDHPDTLTTLNSLAVAYFYAGRQQEAIQLLEQVRDSKIEKLGPDHADTLGTLHCLAGAYRSVGKVPEAIRILEEVRNKLVERLGPDAPATLLTLSNLAGAYKLAGRLPEAIQLYEQVRDKQLQQLGPDHPDTLSTLHELAGAYRAAGNVPEAIRLYEQVRDMRIAKLGPEHPATLNTLAYLPMAYRDDGRLTEAIQLYEQVRDKLIAKLGPDHPSTLLLLNSLASAYYLDGRLPEAISLYEHVRDQRIAKLGPDAPNTLTTLALLAAAYRAAGRLPEALRLYEEVVPKARHVLGPAHANTLKFTHRWSELLFASGEFVQAVAIQRDLLSVERKEYPSDATRLATTLGDLAASLASAGQLAEAESVLKESITLGRKALPPTDPKAVKLTQKWCDVLFQIHHFAKAVELLQELLVLERQKYLAEDPRLTTTMGQLGLNMLRMGQYADAELILNESLAIRRKVTRDDWFTFAVQSRLGAAFVGQKKYAAAEPALIEGYRGMKQHESKMSAFNKHNLTDCLEQLIELYDVTAKVDEAAKWREESKAGTLRVVPTITATRLDSDER
jgi:serine/threonine protein kinase/tetratricopeptide (TPR) repeat protein